MKLKNQNIKLRYTQDIETGEYYFFINNVQVDYYVLLKREVNNGTVTFIPVQRFIGTTNALFNKAVDYFSNQTYKLCRLDGTGNNRVMVYNGFKKEIQDEYVALSYRSYLVTEPIASLQEEYPEHIDKSYATFIDVVVKDCMVKTYNEECKNVKTRARK